MTTLLLFLAGLALLVLGAELLVRGASAVAALAGISPLVIGLTVVAFGTSAPELAVTLAATARGDTDLAMGNVVGSNIFNVLFILGASALIAPLAVSRQLVRLEVPLMIASAVLLLVLALDGRVSRLDGALLLAGAAGYLLFLMRKGSGLGGEAAGGVAAPRDAGAAQDRGRSMVLDLAIAAAGLLLLVLGSRWLVRGAEQFAEALGLSELVIGLTIVAAGTSLPELATSIVASLRGERDIAVGNAVGSNLLNILLILALAAIVSPQGLPAAPAALHFDIPVMIGVSIACLPVFFTGLQIARWEGALFLGYYVAYTTYIILAATGHAAIDTFRTAMLFFVVPLTAVTLLITVVRR